MDYYYGSKNQNVGELVDYIIWTIIMAPRIKLIVNLNLVWSEFVDNLWLSKICSSKQIKTSISF